jgi:hypothetical protein
VWPASGQQGLMNNGGGAFKVAAIVYLTDGNTYAESPIFFQVPIVTVPLAQPTNIKIIGIIYRMYECMDAFASVFVCKYNNTYIYICMYIHTHTY